MITYTYKIGTKASDYIMLQSWGEMNALTQTEIDIDKARALADSEAVDVIGVIEGCSGETYWMRASDLSPGVQKELNERVQKNGSAA